MKIVAIVLLYWSLVVEQQDEEHYAQCHSLSWTWFASVQYAAKTAFEYVVKVLNEDGGGEWLSCDSDPSESDRTAAAAAAGVEVTASNPLEQTVEQDVAVVHHPAFEDEGLDDDEKEEEEQEVEVSVRDGGGIRGEEVNGVDAREHRAAACANFLAALRSKCRAQRGEPDESHEPDHLSVDMTAA